MYFKVGFRNVHVLYGVNIYFPFSITSLNDFGDFGNYR